MEKRQHNRLGEIYRQQPSWKRTKINADLKAHDEKYSRLSYWLFVPGEHFIQMPTLLKLIVCDNIPEAEDLFRLPQPATT